MYESRANPRTLAALITARRIQENERRRQRAVKNGYRGPLTRAEYAALAARKSSTP